MGIDVGLVNKYYDLAVSGDELAREHYRSLEKSASDCIRCGIKGSAENERGLIPADPFICPTGK